MRIPQKVGSEEIIGFAVKTGNPRERFLNRH